MKDEKYKCPHCGEDISALIRKAIATNNRKKNADEMRKRQNNDPRIRAKLSKDSLKRLSQWRKNNPEAIRANSIMASHSRTPETYARQAKTLKETLKRVG